MANHNLWIGNNYYQVNTLDDVSVDIEIGASKKSHESCGSILVSNDFSNNILDDSSICVRILLTLNFHEYLVHLNLLYINYSNKANNYNVNSACEDVENMESVYTLKLAEYVSEYLEDYLTELHKYMDCSAKLTALHDRYYDLIDGEYIINEFKVAADASLILGYDEDGNACKNGQTTMAKIYQSNPENIKVNIAVRIPNPSKINGVHEYRSGRRTRGKWFKDKLKYNKNNFNYYKNRHNNSVLTPSTGTASIIKLGTICTGADLLNASRYADGYVYRVYPKKTDIFKYLAEITLKSYKFTEYVNLNKTSGIGPETIEYVYYKPIIINTLNNRRKSIEYNGFQVLSFIDTKVPVRFLNADGDPALITLQIKDISSNGKTYPSGMATTDVKVNFLYVINNSGNKVNLYTFENIRNSSAISAILPETYVYNNFITEPAPMFSIKPSYEFIADNMEEKPYRYSFYINLDSSYVELNASTYSLDLLHNKVVMNYNIPDKNSSICLYRKYITPMYNLEYNLHITTWNCSMPKSIDECMYYGDAINVDSTYLYTFWDLPALNVSVLELTSNDISRYIINLPYVVDNNSTNNVVTLQFGYKLDDYSLYKFVNSNGYDTFEDNKKYTHALRLKTQTTKSNWNKNYMVMSVNPSDNINLNIAKDNVGPVYFEVMNPSVYANLNTLTIGEQTLYKRDIVANSSMTLLKDPSINLINLTKRKIENGEIDCSISKYTYNDYERGRLIFEIYETTTNSDNSVKTIKRIYNGYKDYTYNEHPEGGNVKFISTEDGSNGLILSTDKKYLVRYRDGVKSTAAFSYIFKKDSKIEYDFNKELFKYYHNGLKTIKYGYGDNDYLIDKQNGIDRMDGSLYYFVKSIKSATEKLNAIIYPCAVEATVYRSPDWSTSTGLFGQTYYLLIHELDPNSNISEAWNWIQLYGNSMSIALDPVKITNDLETKEVLSMYDTEYPIIRYSAPTDLSEIKKAGLYMTEDSPKSIFNIDIENVYLDYKRGNTKHIGLTSQLIITKLKPRALSEFNVKSSISDSDWEQLHNDNVNIKFAIGNKTYYLYSNDRNYAVPTIENPANFDLKIYKSDYNYSGSKKLRIKIVAHIRQGDITKDKYKDITLLTSDKLDINLNHTINITCWPKKIYNNEAALVLYDDEIWDVYSLGNHDTVNVIFEMVK